jgi:acetolactate synthase-1/2/3 large subunit
VVAIVFNNGAYGNVRRDQQTGYGNRLLGADLENPDFVALAQAFGVTAMLARDPAELHDALTAALALNAPVVIEVPVPRGSDTSPWPFIHPQPLA